MDERIYERRFPRLWLLRGVVLRVPGERQPVPGQMVNISETGMALGGLGRTLPVGTEVELEVDLGPRHPPLVLRGVVRRAAEAFAGIEFINTGRVQQRLIRDAVQETLDALRPATDRVQRLLFGISERGLVLLAALGALLTICGIVGSLWWVGLGSGAADLGKPFPLFTLLLFLIGTQILTIGYVGSQVVFLRNTLLTRILLVRAPAESDLPGETEP